MKENGMSLEYDLICSQLRSMDEAWNSSKWSKIPDPVRMTS